MGMAHYWDDPALILAPAKGQEKPGKAEFIAELHTDLKALGYLPETATGRTYDRTTVRAVLRFQRHAARTYRMPQPDAGGDCFKGLPTGTCDGETAREIQKWKQRGWKLPLNRFQLSSLSVPGAQGKLRSDAALERTKIVNLVHGKGATLEGPYGDTHRPVRPSGKSGASSYSFHYCGRAVDICGKLADPPMRYYVCKDPLGGSMFWRIYCKTEKQDGSQGELIRSKTKKWFYHGNGSESLVPEGYYIDLSEVIESTGKFQRIRAQAGWEGTYAKMEWWHFQYHVDKQPTFLDEMELIGYSESMLRKCGWPTDEALDHAPG
jgi:hypothetical protein